MLLDPSCQSLVFTLLVRSLGVALLFTMDASMT
jgi:hypothetical protein